LQESQKRIDYLTKEIEKLQIKQSQQQQQQRIQQQQQQQHQKPVSHSISLDTSTISDSSMDPILTGEDDYKDRDLFPNTAQYLAGDFGPVPITSPQYQNVAGSTLSLYSGTALNSPQMDSTPLELPKKPAYTNLGKYSLYSPLELSFK
jgi:classical protein kinase C